MPTFAPITLLTFTNTRIEIPDACPNCKTDLTQKDTIQLQRICDEIDYADREGDTLIPREDTEDGDGYQSDHPQNYLCANCGHSFVPELFGTHEEFVRQLAAIVKRGDVTADHPDGYEPDSTDPTEDPASTLDNLIDRARSIVDSNK